MSPRNYKIHFPPKTFSFQNPYTAKRGNIWGKVHKLSDWPLLYIYYLIKPRVANWLWDRIYCGGGVPTALMIVHWVAIFHSVSTSIQIQPKYGPLLFWLIRYPYLYCYGPNLINQLKLIEAI